MKTVLHRLLTHAIALLMAALLVCAGQAACMAQSSLAMGMGGCCKHGPCKQSPGTAPHSTCQTAPANPDQAVAPAVAAPVATVASERTADALVVLVREAGYAAPQYTPPDLFILNSSFLI